MRKTLLLLVPVAALYAACVADATDATEEPVGDAVEPGIYRGDSRPAPELGPVEASHAWLAQHHDACGDACYDVGINICGAADACADQEPPETVVCVGRVLTCDAVEHAASGEVGGLSYCWRACEGLR